MNLEQYLEGLRTCHDKLVDIPEEGRRHILTAEFGIYDNFSIFLDSTVDMIVRGMLKRGFVPKNDRNCAIVNSNQVWFDVLPYVPLSLGFNLPHMIEQFGNEEEKEHYRKQKEQYSTGMIMHQGGDNVDNYPQMAEAVVSVGEMIMERGIRACFPRSHGIAHMPTRRVKTLRNDGSVMEVKMCTPDLSRIVYYNPEGQ